jgi:hypothetical protein
MKAVKGELANSKPERVEAFEKGAQAYAKKIVANFKDFEFVRLFFWCPFIHIMMPFTVHW